MLSWYKNRSQGITFYPQVSNMISGWRVVLASLRFLLILLLSSKAFSAVIYRQDFTHPETSTNNISLNAAGVPWTAYASTSATPISNLSSGTYTVLVGPYTTNVAISNNVGYVYTRASNSLVESSFALMSDAFPSPENWTSTGLDLSVYANASHADFDVRLLVEVGNQWYASAQNLDLELGTLTQYRSNLAADRLKYSLNYNIQADASHWVNFNFAEGQGMSLGDTLAHDLDGPITRVGFYTIQPANLGSDLSMARFDFLVISQVPEPSRMVFLMVGSLYFVLRRNRKEKF